MKSNSLDAVLQFLDDKGSDVRSHDMLAAIEPKLQGESWSKISKYLIETGMVKVIEPLNIHTGIYLLPLQAQENSQKANFQLKRNTKRIDAIA